MPGWRRSIRSSASRRCSPAIDRPEPLSRPLSSAAKTMVGRWCWSLMRPASRPTMPACQPGSNRQMLAPSATARPASAASASRCMSACRSRRSRLSASSRCASRSASLASSASRQSMPMRMSAMRPAALSRGPATKPKSVLVTRDGSRRPARSSASSPGRARPLRMRSRPCATKIRLLWSSRTMSATVPSATISSHCAKLGPPSAGRMPIERSCARSAIST